MLKVVLRVCDSGFLELTGRMSSADTFRCRVIQLTQAYSSHERVDNIEPEMQSLSPAGLASRSQGARGLVLAKELQVYSSADT